MNKIVIYARPCVNVVNKDFFHDDELSCVFRLFSYTVSTKYPKSTAMMKNFVDFFLEYCF